MEILKLNIDVFMDLLKPIGVCILLYGLVGLYFKSETVTFERILALFKVIFYLFLAILTALLNVNDDLEVKFMIPTELTIGQLLLITLSLLEAGSNLVTMLSLPKSEFHLVKREQFNEEKQRTLDEFSKIRIRLAELEAENEKLKNI
ncbi:hypothetical protein ACIQ1H_09145 [Lysinibacillus sp. NPDC097279]|uniref:hypothetical protein n=1 Tax=Lysinibacillus sp. NPDC097279 TaxID=3364143 RepID=UPI0038208798